MRRDVIRQPVVRVRGRIQCTAELGSEFADDELHDGRGQFLLVGEVPVDGAAAESGVLGHRDERGLRDAVVGEERDGRLDESSTGLFLAFPARHALRC